MAPKQGGDSYRKDQEVLCSHGENHYYAARIIDVRKTDAGETTYRVHYKGWNIRYDEDIKESDTKTRFMEHTPANVERAAKAIRDARMKVKANKKKSLDPKAKKPDDSRQSTPVDHSRGHSVDSDTSLPSSLKGSTKRTAVRKMAVEVIKKVSKGAKGKSTPTATPTPSRKRKADRDTSEAPSEEFGVSSKRDTESPELEPDEEAMATEFIANARAREVESPARGRKIKYDMPNELRMYLLDGDDLVKRLLMLSKIPARVTVREIMDRYMSDPRDTDEEELIDDTMRSVCGNGIKECFNVVLGKILLYKFERPQYSDLYDKERKDYMDRHRSGDASEENEGRPKGRRNHKQGSESGDQQFIPNMNNHYGFHHLVRMIASFEQVLNHLNWPASCLGQIDQFLEDFTRFLVKNREEFAQIKEDFYQAPVDYQRRVFNGAE
ncbi:hypothetical protein L596_006587 [Steinernema carpocapsae]|uniref:Chromo domain-containing protein n=1 Tax=Steinernema carpocapsae TaxID=34508 RepID=A0A4U8V4W6_STECR|nr:hypothetical protein L596_006587 [Steinernema carpocapsae]